MSFFRSMLFVCPAACLLAQTPPPKPAQPGAPPVTVTLDEVKPAPTPAVPPDTVVLTVGDVKLTAGQFEQIIQSLPQQVQANARANRKQFADNLVKVFVLAQEGKRRKLDETAQYKVQQQVQSANMLASVTYDQIGKDAKLDDAAVKKFYDEHKGDADRVKARHILVRVQGAPMPVRPGQKELTDAEALAKAQELRKKIEGGASFEQVAREESDDSTSGMNGGDLGFFGHNQMVPAFEQAAFGMHPGELSQPVKTQFGYHLIKVETKESKTFEEMRPDIEKRLRPEAAQKALDALQKDAKVEYNPQFFGPEAAMTPIPSPQPGLGK